MAYAKLENGRVVPGDPEAYMKIYPMGFVPAIKDKLRSYVLDDLARLETMSQGVESIYEALKGLGGEAVDLTEVFEMIRVLGVGVQDGLRLSDEELAFVTHALQTDEELAVTFAKISRNPGSFQEIGRSVTEEGAANFHKKWVVSVEGYGHASVAEHAQHHLAVENVASLDGDQATDNRLGSFTEFSARFKGRQDVGWFIPEVVENNPELLEEWNRVHVRLFTVHDVLFERGNAYIATEEAKLKHPQRRVKAKTVADQIKNLMPASRLTSIGVSMNAREAEHTITKMLSAPYSSIREMGAKFKTACLEVAPTLVKYAEANEYLTATKNGLAQMVSDNRLKGYLPETTEEGDLVNLIRFDSQAEEIFIASALYERSNTASFSDLMTNISNFDASTKGQIIYELLGKMGKWDSPIRMLEMPDHYLWEVLKMTYGDWREAKRHRMETYTAKDLHVQWGYMVPPLVKEMDQSQDPQFHGSEQFLVDVMREVEDLFYKVDRIDSLAAQYVVTRLHYRPALMSFNLREAYHFITLRTGPTAHPFIRRLAWPMFDKANAVHPNLMKYLGLRLVSEGRPDRDFQWTV